MYLKKIYHHNKLLFLLILLFASAQLINNIRQDVAISPVYSYGMYSEEIKPKNFYTVPEVFVNGIQLKTKDYLPAQWDNITLPLIKFNEQRDWNISVWHQDIHRLLPFTDSLKFVNNIKEQEFKEWYKHHLQSLLHGQIDSLNMVFTRYSFNGSSFIKANE